MLIRPAVPQDVEAIARIHVNSWRATYRGLMPDTVLDRLSYTEHAERWALRLLDEDLITLVAAMETGDIEGFVLGGKERTGDPNYTAEIYAIYLDPAHLRRGVGGRLVHGLAQALHSQGHHSLLVWVLTANPARHFYMAMGATFVRGATITIDGTELPEEAYGWQDTSWLIDRPTISRIDAAREKLAQLGITEDDIENAVREVRSRE